ncbi:MAG: ATP-binding protein involved in chromosome partitioning [Actinomycetota bacterium]|nr:ATP-binding protein involved in chromosome partitioning [Actinomycetota bacterium]
MTDDAAASSGRLTEEAVRTALATVQDPDIRRPITELGMVESVAIRADGQVAVAILLTVPGCPLKEKITSDVTAAVRVVPGVTAVDVRLGFMTDEQRKALQVQLRGPGKPEKEIPFNDPASLTRVLAIASGKGGVGKSSVTVNVAAALAARGLSVGLLDADIYGHSIPRMLGIEARPTQVAGMIMPPTAHGVRVISIGMFVEGNTPVAWRGTMLHRALNQFLTDVYWGDLDVLLVDLPPGTGDIAISLAQFVPGAEVIVVTTPQLAAAEVAERAGTVALQTRQRVAGVIENMAWLPCPHCGDRVDVFGSGGGQKVVDALTRAFGTEIPLLGQIPLDPGLVSAGDAGVPFVLSHPQAPASIELLRVAESLAIRERGLVGRRLGLQPA